jgi:hypothetical protein
MSPKSSLLFILASIVLTNCLFSQSDGSNSIIISLNAGYRFPDKEKQFDGYNSGFLLDGTIEIGLSKNLFAGLNLMSSKSTDENFLYPDQTIVSRTYNFFNSSAVLKYRAFINNLGLQFGVGVGNTNLRISTKFGEDHFSYLNLSVTTGLCYKIFKHFFISTELTYYQLINSSRDNKMFLFKFGPMIKFN